MQKQHSTNYDVSQGLNLRKDRETGQAHVIGIDGRPLFIGKETKAPKRRFDWLTPWKPGKVWSVCNLRLKAIERLIAGRHRGRITGLSRGGCDNDDALIYFEQAVIYLAARRHAKRHDESRVMSYEWAQTWTPGLAKAHGRDWFIEQEWRLLNAFDDKGIYLPAADAVADALQITDAEVKGLGLHTVGAIDRRLAEREAEADAKKLESDAKYREAQGRKARKASMAATKPWDALGMSRATYFRKIEAGEIERDPRMRPKTPKLRLVVSG